MEVPTLNTTILKKLSDEDIIALLFNEELFSLPYYNIGEKKHRELYGNSLAIIPLAQEFFSRIGYKLTEEDLSLEEKGILEPYYNALDYILEVILLQGRLLLFESKDMSQGMAFVWIEDKGNYRLVQGHNRVAVYVESYPSLIKLLNVIFKREGRVYLPIPHHLEDDIKETLKCMNVIRKEKVEDYLAAFEKDTILKYEGKTAELAVYPFNLDLYGFVVLTDAGLSVIALSMMHLFHVFVEPNDVDLILASLSFGDNLVPYEEKPKYSLSRLRSILEEEEEEEEEYISIYSDEI